MQKVYDAVAQEWHGTRYKAWPRVVEFVKSLPAHSLVGDFGCGNGKIAPACREAGHLALGCDFSIELVRIAALRLGQQAQAADCMKLPYRTGLFDAALSIAVLHHVSTAERRRLLVCETLRVLRRGGKALFYAWASDQSKGRSGHEFEASDVFVPFHRRLPPRPSAGSGASSGAAPPAEGQKAVLQPAEQLLQEEAASMGAAGGVFDAEKRAYSFQRYCHVYREGELTEIILSVPGARVVDEYYDTGNWCVVVEKVVDDAGCDCQWEGGGRATDQRTAMTVPNAPIAPGVPGVPDVPVILITGYAGAGKTHLTNLLLARCVELGLAAGVVAHRQAEEFRISPTPIEVTRAAFSGEVFDFGSGCLCCSPRGEMTRLLSELACDGPALGILLIKLGPMASPLVFARAIIACADQNISQRFRIESIVSVASPQLAPRHLAADGPEWQARAQIAASDLVLLNQGCNPSVAPPATVEPISPADSLIRALHSEVEIGQLEPTPSALSLVLGRRGRFSRERARQLDPDFEEVADAPPALIMADHDRRVKAACAVEDGPLFEDQLRRMLDALVQSGTVLRLKAVVQLRSPAAAPDGAGWLLVEGVEEHITYRRAASPPGGGGAGGRGGDCTAGTGNGSEPPLSKLFVLSRKLFGGSLRREFLLCRVPMGYALAADSELNFGVRQHACSADACSAEQRSGVDGPTPPAPPRAKAIQSDLPGVVVVRGEAGDVYAIDDPRVIADNVRELWATPEHGLCIQCALSTGSPSVRGTAAVVRFRLGDGEPLPEDPGLRVGGTPSPPSDVDVGCAEAIQASCASASSFGDPHGPLRMRAVEVIADGIYVDMD